MDKSDKFSLLIFTTGLFCIVFIIIYLPYEDTHVFNMVAVIGAISSTTASIIAIIQILKIKSSNDVFFATMEVMENNFVIDVISRSIEYVRLIKEYFETGKVQQSRLNFSLLKSELIKITYFKNTNEYRSQLNDFVNFCTSIETSLYRDTLNSDEELSKVYHNLSELESLLQEINIKAQLHIKKA